MIRIVSFLLFVFATSAAAQVQNPPPVGISEKLGEYLPLDQQIYDDGGNLVSLRSVITKPTVITFVYYRCPSICSPLLSEVLKIVNTVDLELGKDFQILTLSFDHTEKPELAQEKRKNYLAEIKTPFEPDGWKFFTGDSIAIRAITDGAGFYFQRDKAEWIHAGALIIVSPEGKITRYLYGIKHLPFDVKMAVYEASEGRTGPTIAKVMKFCFAYDPEGKRYTFEIVRVSGIIIVGFALVFVFIFIVRPKMKRSSEK